MLTAVLVEHLALAAKRLLDCDSPNTEKAPLENSRASPMVYTFGWGTDFLGTMKPPMSSYWKHIMGLGASSRALSGGPCRVFLHVGHVLGLNLGLPQPKHGRLSKGTGGEGQSPLEWPFLPQLAQRGSV